MFFVDLGKSFHRVLRKVMEWSMKREITNDFDRAVMSLRACARTRVFSD